MNTSPLFQLQLRFVFDRPFTEPAWYWQAHDEEADPFNGEDPMTAFAFIETLCENPGHHLAPYSDNQVGQGLSYIFSGDCSNIAHSFRSAKVDYKRKAAVLRTLFHLFRDVFAPRCPRQISAGSQEKLRPLAYICYMFWDVCPLSNWIQPDQDDLNSWAMQTFLNSDAELYSDLPEEVLALMRQHAQNATGKQTPKSQEDIQADMMKLYADLSPETEAYYRAVTDVMAASLRLDNPACIESGLHGLGHLVPFLPDLAKPLIDDFLNNSNNQSAALIQYAHNARSGYIQ
jgi:hypothetical protein